MEEARKSELSTTLQPRESDGSVFLAAKGGSIVFLGALFGYGSQLVIGIFLTRLMGAEQYGHYKVAILAGEMAAGFALLGMDAAQVRYIPIFASRHDEAGLWGTLQVGVGFTTLLSLLIGSGLYMLAAPIAQFLFHEPQLAPLLRIASFIVPFSALSSILGSSTMGFNKMQYQVGAKQIAQPITRLVLLLPLMFLGLTAGKAMAAFIGGSIVTCVMLLYFLNHLFSLNRPINTARRDTRELLRFSLPAYFSTLIAIFGPGLQTLLLGSLNTMTTVGIFAVANQVSTASTLFNQSIGTASSPIISELHGQRKMNRMAHFYKTTAKWMFTVNLPMFLILLLLSTPILSIFGKEFVAGSTALILLSLANLVIAATGVSDGVLAMTGNTSTKLANSVVQVVLSIGLCIWLIPRWGTIGAAAAVLVSSTVIHLLLVIEIFILFRILPYTMAFWKPIAAGVVAVAMGWFTRQSIPTTQNLLFALLNVLVILIVYVGMILLLGLSPEDREVITQLRLRVVTSLSRKG